MAQRNLFNLFGGGNSPAASVGKVAVGAMLVTGTVPAGATAVCRKKVGSTVTTLGAATVTANGAASYALSAAAASGESYGFAWTLPGESAFTAVIVGLGPAATKFTVGASAGSLVAAITGLGSGVTAKSIAPNDGRLAFNAAGNAIVVGLTASAVGTKAYTVILSTGETFTVTVTVEAAAPASPLGPASASFVAGQPAGSLIAPVSGLSSGETVSSISPSNGQVAISLGSALVVGLTASSTGVVNYTITTSAGRTLTIALTAAAGASDGDPTRRMFAATRLRFPTTTGTFPAAGIYQVQSFFIGTPDYPVTEPQFFLPTFYQTTGGAANAEVAGPNVINYEGLSIKVGGQWYSCPTAAFTMDPSVEPSGYLLDAIPGVTLPANTLIECRIAFNGASGATMWGSVRANDLGEVSVGSTSSLAAALTDGRTLTSANAVSRAFIPGYMIAKGWDGRPVGLMVGDSIQAGANENSLTGFLSPRGCMGYWQRGLDDNTQSKRIPFGTIALEGSRPSDMANRANWPRKLDAILKATNANGGKTPMTFIGSNHGNNSASIANPYSWLTGFWQRCKDEWPGVPIYHSEMLPRPSSSDGYQSLANQTVSASDAYNGGTSPGIRWAANDIIGKGAANGDPTAQARSEGWIAGSFAPWRAISFDTGSNRDKLGVVALNTTLSADIASGATTLPLSDLGSVQVGDIVIVNPGGTGAYDSAVRSISGNNVTLAGGGTQAFTAGTKVTAAYNDRTGLHPGPRGHIKIATDAVIPWKISMGWVAGASASATITAEPVGTLTRSGTRVYKLAAGASISGANASHFAVDSSGVVTVSSAGQTAGLNAGPYSLTVTGDTLATSLRIPTEAGALDVYDAVDAATFMAAVNYAYATAPSGTDWVVRPRIGSVSAATTTAGILIKDKLFGGSFTDVNRLVVDETKIQRSAKASMKDGSLTIQPRVPQTAKLVGFANATQGECLVLWASNNIALLDMVTENVAGTDGSDISVSDRTDDNYAPQEATTCIKIRMDGAPTWAGNYIIRGNRIGASDSAPYTRYPTGIKVLSGGNIEIADNQIKNTLNASYLQTFVNISHRRNDYRNFLLDSVDLFNDNYSGTSPAFPASESFYGSSDNVYARPNFGSQFAGAHCDGTQGNPGSTRSMRVSIHFEVHAMQADENVKQTQGKLFKDLRAGVYVRGRITNCVIHMSTLNGLIFAGMDPDDRLVVDKITIFRATEADPLSAGGGRITVEKCNGDATRHGPAISRCIFAVFVDTTGTAKTYTADPVPGGSGSRTLTGGGTVLFNNNLYVDQRTQNTGAGNSAPEVFPGMAGAQYVANRGYQFNYDYTSYASVRQSAMTLFAANSNLVQGASLADIYSAAA
ncbi:hypothetical protein [Methylorubrum suomiense]|uniref:Uncharacterized protein n=1 Tax=Methylorubrum suomiense TaxID=144191 RepID=A0ABQ4UUL7_9HYPH|nr:hypothetical protein [Methylorubrum suomiense]GJE75876.1 hypothetical protein BGCPKDLD_2463 [Methylorubrum suomiense]